MLRARCLYSLKSSSFLYNRLNPNNNLLKPPLFFINLSTAASKPDNLNNNKLENIYSGPLTGQIKAVKVFSITTSFAGLIGQPIIYDKANSIGGLPVVLAICSIVGFFTFVTPVLLHIITKKYVTTIDYDKTSDSYVATLLTFFLRKRKLTFTTKDVVVPDVPSMFSTVTVNKTPVFIDYRQFKDPVHYAKMMGYDKPMDFEMNELNTPKEK